jgi:small subunit ribosomal protein S18
MSARSFVKPTARRRKPRRATEAPRLRGQNIKTQDVDYKDTAMLQRLISAQGKVFSRKRTGLSADCQRKVALALKRARFMAMLPYVT